MNESNGWARCQDTRFKILPEILTCYPMNVMLALGYLGLGYNDNNVLCNDFDI